jgi:DNA polymerase III sliding clamp (beta) subunit (PCNA family)
MTGERVELGFNYKYLLDCFQSINTDSLSIKMAGNAKPMIITPVSDSSFTYLVMPMNR